MKKSQTTIFMVLGIVLIFSVSLIYLSTYQTKKQLTSQIEYTDASDVLLFVNQCLKLYADYAVDVTLLQGGVYEPKAYLTGASIYMLADEADSGGTKKRWEFSREMLVKSMESFINDGFEFCINNFEAFPVDIEHDQFIIKANVEDNNILFDLDYPITITEENNKKLFDEFAYRKNIDIKQIDEVVNDIVDYSIENNKIPYDILKDLVQNGKMSAHLTMLMENPEDDLEKPEAIMYSLNFTNNKNVNFVIDYNW